MTTYVLVLEGAEVTRIVSDDAPAPLSANKGVWYPLGPTDPQPDPTQAVVTGTSGNITNGTWCPSWVTRPLTADELAAALSTAQFAKVTALAASYQTEAGQPVNYTTKAGITKAFQADPSSQTLVQQSLAGYSAAQATPAGFYWIAADNTKVPFAFGDLQGLAASMIAQGWEAFQQLQTLKAKVIAAATVADVQAVVWP